VPAAAVDLEELEAALEIARKSYDSAAATEILNVARSAAGESEGEALDLLRVRAGLLVAELLRLEFEETARGERAARRTLGQRIDVAAEEALGVLASIQESSETERMRADLLATMIRSDYRAKKYRAELNEAVERALERDQENPRALVSSAKPLVFAPVERGRDLNQAIEVLTRALEFDAGLESALLLRAHAYELLGDTERATADWNSALDLNPECRPARRGLDQGSASASAADGG
jgi:tetratricopeptide (TPR) repeat protein